MNTTITYTNEETGDEVSLTVPARWEICDRCRGNGSHDPEAFSNGFSREDFDEDPDFAEDYFAGRYDVTCEECGGSGKVKVADEAEIARNAGLAARYRVACERVAEERREERAYNALCASERMMGA